MSALAEPVAIALRVGSVFDALGVAWYVGGSVASSLHGVPRATQDVDLVADLTPAHAAPLAAALAERFYVDLDLIREAIARRSSFNILDLETVTKVDVFVLQRDAKARVEMLRRQRHPVGADTSLTLPLATPEDIILNKLDWYRRGGRVSERQWLDVIGVIRVNGEALDLEYLHRQAALWGLSDLVSEALASA